MIRLAALASVVIIALDLLITRQLGLIFGLTFPIVCLGAALAVRPTDFFPIGVMPPLLMLGIMGVTAATYRPAIAGSDVGFGQGLINGLAAHAVSLLIGYALCLCVLAIRHHFLGRLMTTLAPQPRPQANLSGSPAPTRVTSGAPEEKSTTVVGNEPHSPESSTASM